MQVPPGQKRLIRTLNGQEVDRPPFWLMRQAGRYLPEYRAIRKEVPDFLTLCYSPDLAVEVTLQPIRRYGMDAAILFSDILVVPDALGVKVAFQQGEGPVLEPIRTVEALDRLSLSGFHDHLTPVYRTLSRLRQDLPQETALIGFAGAPWTLAAYVVEGSGSKDFAVARTLARTDEPLFQRLIDLLTDAIITFLDRQVQAGAEVLQLFDSWAGVLPEDQLERWCIRPVVRIITELRQRHPDVPVIHFPRGAGLSLPKVAAAVNAQAIGLDTSIPIAEAVRILPKDLCLQGNLDPVSLVAGGPAMLAQLAQLREVTRGRPWVFNLGHGVLQQTDPGEVQRLADELRTGSP
ncbi:MAG TPA: uroporphyrinogen decarboxylase [Geminicoccus sp.]|uniref:uroporphyrinogen decarboxylase n=1 Tax=Geminicoccus sp. TaxID=2024832 RepID=UPI002E310974|nr:uroporphyrinogen decarboxylase [Geminicoccus sp.]HEX2526353.1 uroporphyrinogen decarboxylase [Geminicoccus sp.]